LAQKAREFGARRPLARHLFAADPSRSEEFVQHAQLAALLSYPFWKRAVWGRSQYRRTDNRLEQYGGDRCGGVAGYL